MSKDANERKQMSAEKRKQKAGERKKIRESRRDKVPEELLAEFNHVRDKEQELENIRNTGAELKIAKDVVDVFSSIKRKEKLRHKVQKKKAELNVKLKKKNCLEHSHLMFKRCRHEHEIRSKERSTKHHHGRFKESFLEVTTEAAAAKRQTNNDQVKAMSTTEFLRKHQSLTRLKKENLTNGRMRFQRRRNTWKNGKKMRGRPT